MKFSALFSGGKDSVVTAHYLASLDLLEEVVFLDTGIRAPEQVDHVSEVAEKYGWALRIQKTSVAFEELVEKCGFAKPWTHRYYVAGLKGRPFRKLAIDRTYASGVRSSESVQRFTSAKRVNKWERRTITAPILDWTDAQVWAYIRKNQLPLSPCAQALHISGDCFCGAFARPDERALLASFYPDEMDWISSLEEKFGGRWGREDPQKRRLRASVLDSVLCAGCAAGSHVLREISR